MMSTNWVRNCSDIWEPWEALDTQVQCSLSEAYNDSVMCGKQMSSYNLKIFTNEQIIYKISPQSLPCPPESVVLFFFFFADPTIMLKSISK